MRQQPLESAPSREPSKPRSDYLRRIRRRNRQRNDRYKCRRNRERWADQPPAGSYDD